MKIQTHWKSDAQIKSLLLLQTLQHDSGLFSAAPAVSTGYNKSWIRDNIYASLGMEAAGDIASVVKSYRALFDIFKKHEYKIDWAIRSKPKFKHQYIHARYDPTSLNEFEEDWGNKQNDTIGAFLFHVGRLESQGLNILRDQNDKRILQKLVYYLQSIEYWQDLDSGMWEENEEVHASSVGACLSGLKQVKDIIFVPKSLIELGQLTLNELLPNESKTKTADLALLSLIYPYNVVSDSQKIKILELVEEKLLREKGVIRYENDQYYNKGAEAQWTMGLPWLAKIYKDMGMTSKYRYYLEKTFEAMTNLGELPELYYANSETYNENTPLAWSQALFLVSVN